MTRPMTITEKILAKSSQQDEVIPGQLINSRIGLAYTMDFLAKVVFGHLGKLGATKVFDPEKVVVIFDHCVPAPDVKWANLHNEVRKFAKEFELVVYDVGNHGMMHHMVAQEGHLLPGIVALGTDSHALTGGAVGAVVMGIGATDIAIAMATGELWLRVPEAVKVILEGDFKKGVMARDVMSYIIGQKGWDGGEANWAYRSIEFAGETLKKMDMDSRFSLCNLTSDTGAKNGIVPVDEITLEYVRQRAKGDFEVLTSDPDAKYEEVLTVDVGSLEPQVACPDSPDNVHPIQKVVGEKVNVAFIGSCTNGRLSDLRIAAEVLKGRKVHPEVRLTVSPISQQVFNQALDEGLLKTLSDAGAIIAPSTCGPCFGGQLVILGDGDVAISATPRNIKGRMGSPNAQIFGANPAVVAASAIMGEITDPRAFLG